MTAQLEETLDPETEPPARGLPGQPFCPRPGQKRGNSSPFRHHCCWQLTTSSLLPSLPGLRSPSKLGRKSQPPPARQGRGGMFWNSSSPLAPLLQCKVHVAADSLVCLHFKGGGGREGRDGTGDAQRFGSQAEQEHPLQLPAQSTDRPWIASCPACFREKRWKEAKHQLTLRSQAFPSSPQPPGHCSALRLVTQTRLACPRLGSVPTSGGSGERNITLIHHSSGLEGGCSRSKG